MALLINNESPQNIIYNGNEVLKVIYNDVVVWEKQSEQQIYKRRIMVGDNLSNTVIYSDIPDDYLNLLAEKTNGSYRTFISAMNSSNMSIADGYMDGDAFVQIDYPNDRNHFYMAWLENGEIYVRIKSEQLQINFPDGNVATIDDGNESYRHLYIEDPNIRPLQVGDKIVPGTKFYGVVPDDYNANNINSIIYDANNNSVGYFSFYENTAELWIRASSSTSFDYMFQKNPYFSVNNSQIISQTEYVIGSITDEDNSNLSYLLVDTTTLGE